MIFLLPIQKSSLVYKHFNSFQPSISFHSIHPASQASSAIPITFYTAPVQRLLVLARELGPVVGEAVVEPEGGPDQLVVAGAAAGAAQRQVHAVDVLGADALGLDAQGALGLAEVLVGVRGRQVPTAAQRVLHDGGGEVGVCAAVVGFQQLFGEVRHDVDGLGRREEADDGAVAEEAQVAVIGHDVHGAVPRHLRGRGLAGPDVVVGADVAAVKADARSAPEHLLPGRGVDAVQQGLRDGISKREGHLGDLCGFSIRLLEIWEHLLKWSA